MSSMMGLAKATGKMLVKRLPQNLFFDRLYHFVGFVAYHKRFPTKKLLLNDYLYNIKSTREILDPLRVFITDKEYLKMYVKAMIGDKYNVPTIAVLKTAAEIDTFVFPVACCIKPTHASGEVLFRQKGEALDLKKIKQWFEFNYYLTGREANYRILRPKIMVEPLLFGCINPNDFKIFCVKGVPRLIQVDFDRFSRHTQKYFDPEGNELPFSLRCPRNTESYARPGNWTEMLEVASKLSKDFSFVRVDLYNNGEEIKVGEITNCPLSAMVSFIPASAEVAASAMLFAEQPPLQALPPGKGSAGLQGAGLPSEAGRALRG